MSEPPNKCPDCGGTFLSRNVVLQDDANGYVEIERRCPVCTYRWTEAHQNGQFVSVVYERKTRAQSDADIASLEAQIKKECSEVEEAAKTNPWTLISPEVCALCREIHGNWDDRDLRMFEGYLRVGNMRVTYKSKLHKPCIAKLAASNWKERAARATEAITEFIVEQVKKDPRYRQV